MYLRPLDSSSSNPTSSSAKPKARMMQQRCEGGFKLRKLNDAVVEEDNNLVSEPEGSLVSHSTEPTTKEETQSVSAKSQLYTLCAARRWKAPVYECCDNEGPGHMRLFTFRVTIEMKEDSRITVLECYGNPQNKKKIAAEQAAEAALWYLKNVGHTPQTEKASGGQKQTRPPQ